jgi:hypothetical protein
MRLSVHAIRLASASASQGVSGTSAPPGGLREPCRRDLWGSSDPGRDGIDFRQAGFLRKLPGARSEPRPAGRDVRYAFPGLARFGLAEAIDGRYRRNAAGERALAAYDAGVTDEDVDVLRRVLRDPVRMRGVWGLQSLVAAGLAGISTRASGTPFVTEAGLALVEARDALRTRRAA